MMPPIGTAIISASVGAADALLADTDVKNNRTSAGKAWTTWGQAAVGAVGLLIGATRFGGLGPNVSEPLINGALVLGTRNATFRMLTRNASPAVAAYGRLAARTPAVPPAAAHPGVRSAEPAKAAPFMRQAALPTI